MKKGRKTAMTKGKKRERKPAGEEQAEGDNDDDDDDDDDDEEAGDRGLGPELDRAASHSAKAARRHLSNLRLCLARQLPSRPSVARLRERREGEAVVIPIARTVQGADRPR